MSVSVRAECVKPGQEGKRRGVQDAFALALLFLALFLLASMGSYVQPLLSPEPLPQQPDENWCGLLGFHCSRFLFSFLGLAAFFPIGLLFYVMVCVFVARANDLPLTVLGLFGAMISSSALAVSLNLRVFPPDYIAPGGYLGNLVFHLLNAVAGRVGTLLVLLLLLLFSLMSCARFSPFAPFRYLGRLMSRQHEADDEEYFVDVDAPPEPLPATAPMFSASGETALQKEEDLKKRATKPAMDQDSDDVGRKPDKSVRRGRNARFRLPDVSLLQENKNQDIELDAEYYLEVSDVLTSKLRDFGVQGTVVGTSPGPVVTTYEFAPAPGVKINRVVALADDLAMVLKVDQVRVVGSIPGKAAIGIEIPNPIRKTVYLRDIFESSEYHNADSPLSLALGFDVVGKSVVSNLERMPHLLIAGATGAGKSVAINTFITSVLFKARPDEVKLLLIDPKRIELSIYDAIPHLLHPVVVEAKMASRALLWALWEMERRYCLLEELRVKSFASYNAKAEEKLPHIIIIVDELADLMMVASKDVETSITRLAQMARAAGMHIILATQRPSVDVLTGLIKANFPTRISFKVSSKVDSRIILDGSGAEHLLGMGDMLFLPPGTAKLQRIHGAFISEEETDRVVAFLKRQGTAEYDENMMKMMEEEENGAEVRADAEDYDEKYDEAVAIVVETGQASLSMMQRRLRVGYNRAARIIEIMEREGIVGPADGSRPREVLIRPTCRDKEI